jgi:Ca2+-binding RTX toxin-like protein
VSYTTASGGTATEGADYTFSSGSLNWADGDATPKTFSVPIINDGDVEGNETVDLALGNPGGAALGMRRTAVLNIVDNDQAPIPPWVSCAGLAATIIGTAGDETLIGTAGADVIHALGGADSIAGKEGNDVICGGDGNDVILISLGNDDMRGDLGNDQLGGGAGADRLRGGPGADQVFGDEAGDTLLGDDGVDRLDGGGGTDNCDGGPPDLGDTAVNCELSTGVP